MKKETFSPKTDELEDSIDEPDNYFGPGSNVPKYSPIRRKAKFRAKNFKTKEKHKYRKRNLRNKIKDDFGFWEE